MNLNRSIRGLLGLLCLAFCSIPMKTTGETMSACGFFGEFLGCRTFHTLDGTWAYVLAESLDAPLPRSAVNVSGTVHDADQLCSPFVRRYLTDIVITPCVPETVGCGRIEEREEDGDRCTVWVGLSDGAQYTIGRGGFAVGDTVRLACNVCFICDPVPGTCPGAGHPAFNARLFPCADTLTSTRGLSWGRLKSRYLR